MKLETTTTFKNIKNNNLLVELSQEDLKRLQKTLLGILSDFNDVCNKHNIVYTLGGGSALGAIRHKGFIPWDDDIDINMERKEYEKFKKVFSNELSNKYWFHNPEDRPDLGLGMARLRLKGTILRSREDLKNDECGVFIDIFIIENTYDFLLMRYIHGFLSLAAGFLLSCRNFYKNRELYMMLSEGNERIFKTKIFIGRLISWITVRNLTKLWNNANRLCTNDESKYITIPSGRKHFFGELYLRKDICEVETMKFEDIETLVSKGYDNYLTKIYKDYMSIPEDKNREKHVILDYKV